MKYSIYLVLISLILIVGCAETPEQPALEEQEPAPTLQPEEQSPEDTTTSRDGSMSEETGDGSPETTQATDDVGEDIGITSDINELLEKGKTKLKSYSYSYKPIGSNIDDQVYVKGSKIKVAFGNTQHIDEEDKHYNTIYFDMEERTAEAYCNDCKSYTITDFDKVTDLDYDEAYVETSLDWLAKVTEAKKTGEVEIEGRDCMILDTNIGQLTVESYYGFLYAMENDDGRWEAYEASFNSVDDAEVNPPVR